MIYQKSVTTVQEQLEQLKKRGLAVKDEQQALRQLANISYYRLAGYWWSMQSDKVNHIFKPNSKFEDAIALYNFDRELRIILFAVIERIEISLRTKLIYHLSHEFDFWWFQRTDIFQDTKELIKTLGVLEEELERSKDIFIKEHKKKYKDDNRFPPAIKLLEITSFGGLSKLYGNLKPTVRSKDIIAAEFKTVNHTYLPSWLQTIAQIRNICAHHGRLWNKNLPGRPALLSKPPAPWLKNVPPVTQHEKLYIHVCCMKYLLDVAEPENHFTESLSELLNKYPSVDLNALGFTSDWLSEPLWKIA